MREVFFIPTPSIVVPDPPAQAGGGEEMFFLAAVEKKGVSSENPRKICDFLSTSCSVVIWERVF